MDAGLPAPVVPGAHAVPVSVKGVAVQDGKVLLTTSSGQQQYRARSPIVNPCTRALVDAVYECLVMKRYACPVVRERWKPSLGWRAVMAVHLVPGVGFCYVIMRFFFPHVFLLPVVIAATVLGFGCCVAPLRVLLDHSAGELAITIFWTVHVPLAQIKSVKELPFGVKIKTVGSVYEFGGRTRYFRLLKGLLRIRTGFEGMERAVAQAVATMRAASSEDAEPEGAASQPGLLIACLFLGGGLLALAVAVAVQPQAGVWLVHILAWLLRIYFDAGGFVVMLLGVWFLHNALRDRRDVRRPGLLTERNGSSHSTVR